MHKIFGACLICGKPITRKGQSTCSVRCRKKASRSKVSLRPPAEARFTLSDIQLERVNEITWKLMDSKGRAIAWLMNVGWIAGTQQWVMRCENLRFGPTTFHQAKEAMFKVIAGGFEEPLHVVKNPIKELNAITTLSN